MSVFIIQMQADDGTIPKKIYCINRVPIKSGSLARTFVLLIVDKKLHIDCANITKLINDQSEILNIATNPPKNPCCWIFTNNNIKKGIKINK